MLRSITLSIAFTFCILDCSAQTWLWAEQARYYQEHIDVAVGPGGELITISQGEENRYYLDVYDSSGVHVNQRIWYFDNYTGDELMAVGADDTGNIYVISRQLINIAEPGRVTEEWSELENNEGWELVPLEPTPEYHSFIVLEKYSRKLELLTHMKLLSGTGVGNDNYFDKSTADIFDFVVDGNGNCWLVGRTDYGNRMFWREDVALSSTESGCQFVLKVGSRMKQVDWIKVFEGQFTGYTNSIHIAVNKDGICIMSGTFRDAIVFGDLDLKSKLKSKSNDDHASEEMFLVAVSSDGTILWAQSMGVQSMDNDVVALSGGGFVASGRCYHASKLGNTKLPKKDMTTMFLLELDPKTGKHEQVFTNDTSNISNLEAGSNNDFFCNFQLGGSSYAWYIYHFDSNLNPKLLTRFLGHEPISVSRKGSIYYYGSWMRASTFGFMPDGIRLEGEVPHHGLFLAKFDPAIKD